MSGGNKKVTHTLKNLQISAASDQNNKNDLYKIPSYSSIQQTRISGKTGDGLAVFIHNT